MSAVTMTTGLYANLQYAVSHASPYTTSDPSQTRKKNELQCRLFTSPDIADTKKNIYI